MNAPPPTADEAARLRSLKALHILDTPAEERFDRISRLACRAFRVPAAGLGLVDAERTWFKSKQGLCVGEIPRAVSFCSEVIAAEEVLVVADAERDARFHDDRLVREARARFLAGTPLRDREGRRLGALFVLDRAPRSFDADDRQTLRDLAALAQTELRVPPESTREGESGTLDEATGAWNRRGTLELLQRQIENHMLQRSAIAVVSTRIDNLAELGASRPEGGRELVMAEVAQVIRRCMRARDAVGRIGDDGFVILLFDTDEHTMSDNARRICSAVSSNLILGSALVDIRFGIAGYVPGGPTDAEELVQIAERDLKKPSRFLAELAARSSS